MSNPGIIIRYADSDYEVAKRIADEFRKVGLRAWFDESSLRYGRTWVEETERFLNDAGFLLVLLSSAFVDSKWGENEWSTMLTPQLSSENGGIAIPIRLEEVQPPTLFQSLQYVDLFPDFDAGVYNVIGPILMQTFPAWFVQVIAKDSKQTNQEVVRNAPVLQVIAQGGHSYLVDTVVAWHGVVGEAVTDAILQQLDTRTIRRIALHCVAPQDLQSFCLDTDTDIGSLSGSNMNEQILSLLHVLLRDAKLEKFIRWLADKKPRCVREAVRHFLPGFFPRHS